MKTSEFFFSLPQGLIAQEPSPQRESARLLVLDRESGSLMESAVRDLATWIEPRTLVVLNDTRVRKARLFGETARGDRVELLLIAEREPGLWEVMTGKARKLLRGGSLLLPGGVKATLEGIEADVRLLRFEPRIDEGWIEAHGHVPLPPYIRRQDTRADEARYQTVYSRVLGSAAAPTAGLHLSSPLLAEIEARGAVVAFLTLHVGLGTFLPIRAECIEDHAMHEELYSIPSRTCRLVEQSLVEHHPIMAVGTTVVRALESAWENGRLREGEGRTRLFIAPGYRFRVVSRLLTNFHTPGSSLLVLVSAFAGRERILSAYEEAVRKEYRFFSYGDAMLIR